MKWIGCTLLGLIFFACRDKQPAQKEGDTSFDFQGFNAYFKKAALPYHLPDSELLNNTDTTYLRNVPFLDLIPDSIKMKMLGKAAKVRYVPVARLGGEGKETYYILKAVENSRKAALLVTLDRNNNYTAAFPFLIPDKVPNTTQVSTIDKSFSVTRTVSRKSKDDVVTEGKDVYAYNEASKAFTLIMTELLDEDSVELINPIDTFSKKTLFAGDYGTGKKNLVSIRDGRNSKELDFYIYFERGDDDCTGQLKGTAFFTSGKTAVFRQGGEACVLEFQFTPGSVILKEAGGCGLYRGIKCTFDGTYKKIKPAKKKAGAKK
jgi:hypothetical protein